MAAEIDTSTDTIGWKRPSEASHGHFDCFSGAAGDMMLASCLDAAGDEHQSRLLSDAIVGSLEQGLPELKGEFAVHFSRVWRGMGSIAALHVIVDSKYDHKAAPVPKKAEDANQAVESSLAGHHGSTPSHEHSHDHNGKDVENTNNVPRDQNGEHAHTHEHHAQDHDHSHGHGHSHSHEHSHDHNHSTKKGDNHDHSHDHGSDHNHSHGHDHNSSTQGPLRNLPEIRAMLQNAPEQWIPQWVKDMAIASFTALAEAEALTHGAQSMDHVHFHEVGAVDSIVDTVGTLLALWYLKVTSVTCSRLPIGEGTVWTDHGLLPVPAPATLRLLVGLPTCAGPPGITGELVTPTGAALLKTLVTKTRLPSSSTETGRPPNFTIRQIGIGAGTKDFKKHPNIVRLWIGDTIVARSQSSAS